MKCKHLFRLKYLTVLLSLFIITAGCSAQQAAEQGWKDLTSIVKNIVPPTFANRDYSILNYGAKADGKTDCLPAIKSAISTCNKAGGGRVIVPAGTYFVKIETGKNITTLKFVKE